MTLPWRKVLECSSSHCSPCYPCALTHRYPSVLSHTTCATTHLTLSVLTRTHTRTHPSHLIVIPGYSLTPLVLPSSLMRVISLIPVSTPITCLLTHSLTHSLTHMSSLCTLTHTHPHKSSHSLPRTLTHDFCYHTHSPTPMSSLCTHTSLLRERLLSLMSSLCSLECSHTLLLPHSHSSHRLHSLTHSVTTHPCHHSVPTHVLTHTHQSLCSLTPHFTSFSPNSTLATLATLTAIPHTLPILHTPFHPIMPPSHHHRIIISTLSKRCLSLPLTPHNTPHLFLLLPTLPIVS